MATGHPGLNLNDAGTLAVPENHTIIPNILSSIFDKTKNYDSILHTTGGVMSV